MSTAKRFAKNTIILILAKALQPFITFYLIITISREIGLAGFGAYSVIFKYLAIFSVVAGFGLRNLLTREISQNKALTQQYLLAGSVIAIICAIISALLMGLVVSLLSDNNLVVYGAILASVSLLAIGIADVYEGVISAYEQIRQVGYALLAENLFRVAVTLVLIFSGYGILIVVCIFVISRFLSVAYLGRYIHKHFASPFGKPDKMFLYELFNKARTFALIMVSVAVYWNLDGIMLESMRSAEEAGYYSAAFRFLALAMILVHSYVSSLFPVISIFFKSARNSFESACRKSLRLLILATIPIAVLLSLLAERVIVFLFSSQYLPSVTVLRILIWGLVPYAVSQIFAYAMVASERQTVDLRVNIISVLANALLNFILIPQHGFVGASIATFISINIYVGLQLPFVLKKIIRIKVREAFSYGGRTIIATLLMIAVIYFIDNLSLFIIPPVGLFSYLLLLLILGLVTKSDRQLIYRIVGLKI